MPSPCETFLIKDRLLAMVPFGIDFVFQSNP
jgi:hypothetical protein